METQESPFAVQVELSEGCQLYCTFCGLQGIREKHAKNFKFMTEDVLRSLVRQMVAAGWNPRLEFAMHGEPTMHPHYVDMIRAARQEAPRYHVMMTSNGGGLLKDPLARVQELFAAGLNVLALDDYEGVKIVSKIRAALPEPVEGNAGRRLVYAEGGQFEVYEYPADRRGSPPQRRAPKDHVLTLLQDISKAEHGNHATLNNHAGSAFPPLPEPLRQRCAKPFREMSVRWDGSVAVCCNDWRGTYKCGNVVADGLMAVWDGAPMVAARRLLMASDRDFGPCRGCDAKSYRVGLLPDKLGRQTLPAPTQDDRQEAARACAGPPYSAAVARPWEIA